MTNRVLRVERVEKSFGAVRAVDGVSFGVDRGEIFALLGPNGAGKSTTVRMLVGILKPDAGTVEFDLTGEGVSWPTAEEIGYLPEDRGLYPEVPVLKTLTYMGVLRGMPRADARVAAGEWLERLELSDRADDKLDALSKGNQQKVQLISALLHRPALVILDEPFSGLDPLNQERFLTIIRELRDGGTTVLLSAHQMSLVERLADRLLLMAQGRVAMAGTLDEIKTAARSGERILVRLADDTAAPELESLPGVTATAALENGELAVELAPDARLGPLVTALGERFELEAIRSEEISLHDIYVRHLGDAAEPPVAEAAAPAAGGEV